MKKKFSEEALQKIRFAKLGDKNPMWRGDKVKYWALHEWIKYRKPKPLLCEECHKKSPFDLANINHRYTRNLNDWQWICRRCHMLKDGRLIKFIKENKLNYLNFNRANDGRFCQKTMSNL